MVLCYVLCLIVMKKNLYLLRFASCKKNKNRLSNDFHNEYSHEYEIKRSQSISGKI